MFSHHDSIAKHNFESIISEIKASSNPDSLKKNNKHNLSLLQVAAREGSIELALWLLYSGSEIDKTSFGVAHDNEDALILQNAQKTPLYYAVERHHFLLASILLVCGADKNKAIQLAERFNQQDVKEKLQSLTFQKHIKYALLVWTIVNFHKSYEFHLLDAIFHAKPSQEEKEIASDELSQFITLAAYLKNDAIAKYLGRRTKVKFDPAIPTAGYWAAINNLNGCYDALCQDEYGAVLTLRQLKFNSVFNQYYNKLTAAQKDRFHKTKLDIIVENHTLTEKQMDIYRESQAANKDQILSYDADLNDCYAVIQHAFQRQDFVALLEMKNIRSS